MDRRKQKTQDAIMSAFLELIFKKNLEKITISEIAEKANVNRGTIYLNYLDKYDLLDHCIELHLENLIKSCKGPDSSENSLSKDSLVKVFEYLEAQRDFFKILLANKGLPIFTKKLQDEIIQNITTQESKKNIQSELSVYFLSSAIVGVLEWWFTQENPYSANKVAEELWLMLNANIQSVIQLT